MRDRENRAKIALFAVALVGMSGLALAQARTPADSIPYRQQQLKMLGGAFKAVNDEVRGGAPNVETIRTNAATIQKLAAEFPTWFPAGSGPEAGVRTAAKPEIWTNAAGFAEKVKALQDGAAGLVTASAGSDTAAIGAAARAGGGACQGCHAEFRLRPAAPPAPPVAATTS